MLSDLKSMMAYAMDITMRGGITECNIMTGHMGTDDQGLFVDLSIECEEPCQGYEHGEWEFTAKVRDDYVVVRVRNIADPSNEDLYTLTLENFAEFITNQQRFHIREYAD